MSLDTHDALDRLIEANRLRSEMTATIGRHRLGLTQWLVLKLLHRNGMQQGTQLARSLGVTREMVTMTVNTLVRSGYVSTARLASDGRGKALRLTPNGLALVDAIDAELEDRDGDA